MQRGYQYGWSQQDLNRGQQYLLLVKIGGEWQRSKALVTHFSVNILTLRNAIFRQSSQVVAQLRTNVLRLVPLAQSDYEYYSEMYKYICQQHTS